MPKCGEIEVFGSLVLPGEGYILNPESAFTCAAAASYAYNEREWWANKHVKSCYLPTEGTKCSKKPIAEKCNELTLEALSGFNSTLWDDAKDVRYMNDNICQLFGMTSGLLCKADGTDKCIEADELTTEGPCTKVKTLKLHHYFDESDRNEIFNECAANNCNLRVDLWEGDHEPFQMDGKPIPVGPTGIDRKHSQAGNCSEAKAVVMMATFGVVFSLLV